MPTTRQPLRQSVLDERGLITPEWADYLRTLDPSIGDEGGDGGDGGDGAPPQTITIGGGGGTVDVDDNDLLASIPLLPYAVLVTDGAQLISWSQQILWENLPTGIGHWPATVFVDGLVVGSLSITDTLSVTRLTTPAAPPTDMTIAPSGDLVLDPGSGRVTTDADVYISTLTAGSVVFAGAGGLLSQDNANLYWDDANDRLGVGTVSPQDRLHVSGGNILLDGNASRYIKFGAAASGQPLIWNVANGHLSLWANEPLASGFPAAIAINNFHRQTFTGRGLSGEGEHAFVFNYALADPAGGYLVTFQQNGTSRLNINATNGNVGIATVAPTAALHVTGKVGINHTGLGGTALDVFGTGAPGPVAAFQTLGAVNGNSVISVNGTVTGTLYGFNASLSASGAAVVYLQQNHASGYALYEAVVLGSGDAFMRLGINGGQVWTFGLDNSDADKFKIGGGNVLGASDYLTIDTTGFVGIGTTTPSTLLEVFGNVTIRDFFSLRWGTSGAAMIIGGSGAAGYLSLYVFGSEMARLAAGGKFLVGNTFASTGTLTHNNSAAIQNSLGVGTNALQAVGTNTAVFADGTAPSSMPTDTAGIYAEDVGGTVKMFVITEAGVSGQIATLADIAVGGVSGSGTTGKVPKWSSSSALTDSIMTETSATNVTIAGSVTLNGPVLNAWNGALSGNGNVGLGVSALGGLIAGSSANVGIGYFALSVLTTGRYNTAVGYTALASQAAAANHNTAIGAFTLTTLTSGEYNVAVGSQAMEFNTTGGENVAIGVYALRANTTGYRNVAVGYQALTAASTTTSDNAAVGYFAGRAVTTGAYNAIFGANAARLMTTGINNVMVGSTAGEAATTGGTNTLIGSAAGTGVTTGNANTFVGANTGLGITTGNYNTVVGASVGGLPTGLLNTVIIADGQGNQRIYVDSSGNVGLGTTSPNRRLEVLSTTNDRVARITSNSVYGTLIEFFATGAGGRNWEIISTANSATQGGGRFVIADNPSGTQLNRLIIDSAGALRLPAYGAGILSTDASGNVTAAAGALGVTGGGTGTTTVFTAGSVVFAGPSGVYAQDNASLFWDDANNRLGIGTASPTRALDVASTATDRVARITSSSAFGALVELYATGTGGRNWEIISTANSATQGGGRFVIADNPSGTQLSRFTIDSSGNVGIGTTSPGYKLDVNGSVGITGALTLTGTLAWGGGAAISSSSDVALLSAANVFTGGVQKVGAAAGTHLELDTNQVSAWNNVTPATLYFNYSGGLMNFGNGGMTISGIGTVTGTGIWQTTAADGVADNVYVADFRNMEATAGRSFGLYLQAGSTFSDSAFYVRNVAAADLFRIRGDGAVTQAATANSSWAMTVANNGTTDAHGLYVNIGSGSNGIPFRVDFGGASIFDIANNGASTFATHVQVNNPGNPINTFNSTHASGGYTVWKRSGTSLGYLGMSQSINGGSFSATDFMLYGINALELVSGASSIRFLTGTTLRWTMDTSGAFVAGVAVTGNLFTYVGVGAATLGGAGTSTESRMSFYNANGLVGNIQTSGTTTAYNTSSDARLKRDRGVVTQTDVLRRTLVHDFDWIADGTRGRGVFAQEAQLVAPFAVSVGSEVTPWAVDYSKYVPDLIVGWQDHDARISALERKLHAE